MSSPKEFHLFNQLPAELRVAIWKLAILDHNRDRLLLVNEHTNRIMCIQNNACSPHFRVSSESRDVARDLYPIRLPVFSLQKSHPQDPMHIYVVEDADLVGRAPPQHAVYISTEHDVFVLGAFMLAPYSELVHLAGTRPPGGPANWAWRTPSLTGAQCRGARRVALFDFLDESVLPGPECRRMPRCIIMNHALQHGNDDVLLYWRDDSVFTAAREFLYVVLDPEVINEAGLHAMLFEKPGHKVLATFYADHGVAQFNEKEMKEFPYVTSPGCICNSAPPAQEHN